MQAPEAFSCTILTGMLVGCIAGAIIMAGAAFAVLLWVIDYILNSWRT